MHTRTSPPQLGKSRCRRSMLCYLLPSLGVFIAFMIVLLWFPGNLWANPIQSSDAPAHYYFIDKLYEQGLGAAFRLWPNNEFYPPLFHILAYGIRLGAAVLGIGCTTLEAFNIVWILSSGILFPIGMVMLCSYLMAEDSIAEGPQPSGPGASPEPRARKPSLDARSPGTIMRSVALMCVPILSVTSINHPYTMLRFGPLVAFGFATCLLPFALLETLRLFDAIATPNRPWRLVAARLTGTTLAIIVLALAHPRVMFSFALLIGMFVLIRLPRWLAASGIGVILLGACAYVALVLATERSSRLGNPDLWFHSHKPSKTLLEALWYAVSDGLDGIAGVLFAVLLLGSVTLGVVLSPRASIHMRNLVSLTCGFLILTAVYAATVTFTGGAANLISAPWYRDENRIVSMFPIMCIPLIVVGLQSCLIHIEAGSPRILKRRIDASITANPRVVSTLTAVLVTLLVAAATVGQLHDPARRMMAESVLQSASLDKTDPSEQLTARKAAVLREVVDMVGTQAPVVSDPLNGSMYAATLFDAHMFYPIINAQTDHDGAMFARVEQEFASGDRSRFQAAMCSLSPGLPTYFLTLGPQAASLQSFPFRGQYAPFHDDRLIEGYLHSGAMRRIRTFGAPDQPNSAWALYQVHCA